MTDRTDAGAEDLYHILANEAEGYRQLVAVTQREQAALKEDNLSVLLTIVQDKEELIGKLKEWEHEREEAVVQLAQTLELSPEATLSDLISKLDNSTAQKLSVLRNEFLSVVEQFSRLNHSNRLMLQVGLVRVNSTFEYLAKITSPKQDSYGANGIPRIQSQTAAGNVLNREA